MLASITAKAFVVLYMFNKIAVINTVSEYFRFHMKCFCFRPVLDPAANEIIDSGLCPISIRTQFNISRYQSF